jgi:hypothetical protein
MTGMIRRLVWAGVAVVAGLSSAVLARPEGVDPGRAAEVAESCARELDPRLDRDVFAGAEEPGSPIQALALYLKWEPAGRRMAFTAHRPDLDRIVKAGGSGESCVVYCRRGYRLASTACMARI